MRQKTISRRGLLTLWRRATDEPPAPATKKPHPSPRSAVHPRHAPKTKRNKLLPLTAAKARRATGSAGAAALLRPPGALAPSAFLEACERSGRCAEACPVKAISLVRSGPAAGTPYVDPTVSACVLCDGLACTHACPSGALRPIRDPSKVRMGTARIEPELCTAYRGLPCRICYEVCPIPGVLVMSTVDRRSKHEQVPKERRSKTDRRRVSRKAKVPVGGSEICVGCGMCQNHCPSEGAIHVVPHETGAHGKVQVAPMAAVARRR